MEKAVFIDRDGVLNRIVLKNGERYVPLSIKEFQLLPRVDEACRLLKSAGFRLFVVTNQPEIARKELLLKDLEEMHQYLLQKLGIDKIYFCGHTDEDNCLCRKPKTGLLDQATREFGIDVSGSFMVGDRRKDMDAGKKAGCRTVYVESTLKEEVVADHYTRSLYEAAVVICGDSP